MNIAFVTHSKFPGTCKIYSMKLLAAQSMKFCNWLTGAPFFTM